MNFSRILLLSLPGAEGPAELADLQHLKQQSIQAIVRMEEQTISGEAMDLIDLYEPVADFAPPNLEQIQRILMFIRGQIVSRERPTAVTCYAGIGRTGTVLLVI